MYRLTLSFDILNYSPPPQKNFFFIKGPTLSKFLTFLNKHNPIHPDYNNLRSTTPPPPNSLQTHQCCPPNIFSALPPPKKSHKHSPPPQINVKDMKVVQSIPQ